MTQKQSVNDNNDMLDDNKRVSWYDKMVAVFAAVWILFSLGVIGWGAVSAIRDSIKRHRAAAPTTKEVRNYIKKTDPKAINYDEALAWVRRLNDKSVKRK